MMHTLRLILDFRLTAVCLGILCLVPALARAEGRPIEQVVDHHINLELQKAGVSPVPLAPDTTLARRTMLDLAGRIPTMAESRAYAESREADKRLKLVDRVISSPEFARHQRDEFDALLMPERSDNDWKDYLLKVFQENRPWDQVFRQIMLASSDDEPNKGAVTFLKKRLKDPDVVTRDTSRIFFGVDVSCAKCHDHPLVEQWKQDHYYGMQSFFSRTYLVKDKIAERDYGLVKFKTTTGEEKEARPMFLSGASIDEPPSVEPSKEDKQKQESNPQPPSYSRRAKLVEVALAPETNHFFARAAVNLIWARLFGQGLVSPVDQMHSENPPNHPELLDWLAKDLVQHNYDLRRLIRGLVLSDTYARSSRWDSTSPAPPATLFAMAAVRPLTPHQYSMSLSLASQDPQSLSQAQPQDLEKRLEQLDRHSSGFAEKIEQPDQNFQVSVMEALLLSNSEQVQREYFSDRADRLVGNLKANPDRQQSIDTMFWTVLSRPAEPDEAIAVKNYLAAREDRLATAYQQVTWALVTSAEFRFNH